MNYLIGLAYSILAGVPPVVGIYMAFFPVFVYAIMGTSRQVSMGILDISILNYFILKNNYLYLRIVFIGTFSIILMMAGKSVAEFGNENGIFKGEPTYTAIEVTTALSIVVGIWQVSFHFKFRLYSRLCIIFFQ